MAALTDFSDILNRATGGNNGTPENLFFYRDGRITGGTAATGYTQGQWETFWWNVGSPGLGAIATSGATYPTNATAGALAQTDPGGGRTKWLIGATACATYAGIITIYDRLATYGGLSGTSTSEQTCTMTLSSRYTSSSEAPGNEIWVEIGTQIGTSGTTATCSYTNEGGTASRTTQAITIGGTGYRETRRILRVPLQSGDRGVTAVASITLAGSTGTAGDFAVIVARPLFSIAVSVGCVAGVREFTSSLPGPIEIKTDACLAIAYYCHLATGASHIFGSLHMIEA